MSSQIIAVCNADVNDISFLNVFTQDSTLFNDGFTFQKLPFPSHVITVIRKLLSYILVTPVADPGGSLGQLSPSNVCGAPLKWRPSDINAPLFGAYRDINRD